MHNSRMKVSLEQYNVLAEHIKERTAHLTLEQMRTWKETYDKTCGNGAVALMWHLPETSFVCSFYDDELHDSHIETALLAIGKDMGIL